MAEVVIKDPSGSDCSYPMKPKIRLKTSVGDKVIYSKGEAVEGVEIDLDFTDGDQTVTPESGALIKSAVINKPEMLIPENVRKGVDIGGISGTFIGDTEEITVPLSMANGDQIIEPSAEDKVLSKVTVQKPETMIPENIASGIVIGGVLGTFAGKKKEIVYASGNYVASSTGANTVTHDLGKPPDIIVVRSASLMSSATFTLITGFSAELVGEEADFFQVGNKRDTNDIVAFSLLEISDSADDSFGFIQQATPKTFVVGGTTFFPHISGDTYYWSAIGGLAEHSGWFYIKLVLDKSNLIVTGGVPAIEQLNITVNGTLAKTVDYVHGDEFIVDLSDVLNWYEPLTISVEAVGENLAELYPNQYYDSVSNGIVAGGTCGESAYWTLTGDGVLNILGTGAMYDYTAASEQPWYGYVSDIKEVVFETGISKIGGYSFYGCSAVTKISIPDSVTSLGSSVFYNCTSVEAAYFDGTLEQWLNMDFGSWSANPCCWQAPLYIGGELVTEIVIPDSITAIKLGAFYGCSSLKSVVLHDGVTEIASRTFTKSGLTEIIIPDSVTSIGVYAFYDCNSLTSVVVGSGVTLIPNSAFRGCELLASVTLRGNVTQMDDYAFADAIITAITLPASLTLIGLGVFYGCTKLTSITIPANVKQIYKTAFRNCTALTSATFKTTSGWYRGSSAGTKTYSISSSYLANTSTAAKYLRSTYAAYYWTRS